jgi:hypothetical protein
MNSSQAKPPAPAVSLDRERRREHRRPAIVKATVTVLDGAGSGASHDVMTRDLSDSGVSFLLRDGLNIGQNCRVTLHNGKSVSYLAEVVRSRPLSTGKFEMAVVFRSVGDQAKI